MNLVFKFRKSGFTLAEVLITLAVIGVIASLTIPSLINNVQDAQYKAAYKKAYADLNQVAKRMLLDTGGNFAGMFTSSNVLRNKFASYMNVTQKCNDSLTEGCWANTWYKLNGNAETNKHIIYLSKSQNNNDGETISGMLLNNGQALAFYFPGITEAYNCTFDSGTIDGCAVIAIDVNGPQKKPNTIGKDLFYLYVTKYGIKPYGYAAISGSLTSCTQPPNSGWSDITNSGYGCALEYLKQ